MYSCVSVTVAVIRKYSDPAYLGGDVRHADVSTERYILRTAYETPAPGTRGGLYVNVATYTRISSTRTTADAV